MEYDERELRAKISEAVLRAFERNPATTTEIIDSIFVQVKPIVMQEQRAYSIAQLRELLSILS